MKKIIWGVIITHVTLVGLTALWVPYKKHTHIPLKIRNVSLQKPQISSVQTISSPSQNETSTKETKKNDHPINDTPKNITQVKKEKTVIQKSQMPKKDGSVVKNTSKKKQVPTYLINQLQESIAKIEQNCHKEVPQGKLTVPTSFFKIESIENDEDGNAFTTALIDCFKKELQLPETGEVKIALTLKKDGSLIDLKLLSKESQSNAQFLEKALHAMRFPPFNGALAKQKEHTFVITFCNR